jgi:hypothetical protein
MLLRIPYLISLRFSGRLRETVELCERWARTAREQGDVFTALWMQLMDIRPSCDDDPTLAHARVEDAIEQLEAYVAHGGSSSCAAVVRLIGQVRRAELDWYESKYDTGYKHIAVLTEERSHDTLHASATETPLHTMQHVWHRCRALCGLLALPEVEIAPDEIERRIAELEAQYAQFKIPTMTSGAAMRAAAAKRAGDIPTAIRLLEDEARYAAHVLAQPVWAACFLLHAGKLLGDARGDALVARAKAVIEAQGVKNAEAWARMTVPGF